MNHESQEAALEEVLEAVGAAVNAVRKKDISMLQKSYKSKKKANYSSTLYSSILLSTCRTGL